MRIRLLSGLAVLLGLAQGAPGASAQLRTATVSTSGTLSGTSTTSTRTTTTTLATTGKTCPTPTLDQCTDPAWLDSSCGQTEAASGTTCEALIDAAMQATADDADPSWVPWSMHPEGVARAVDAGSFSTGEHYSPDPLAIGSGYVAAEYGMSIPQGYVAADAFVARDPYDGWALHPEFRSCEEYVYERYYQIHELLRAVGDQGSAPLDVVRIAFGPDDDPASYGTHHLTSSWVRDVAGNLAYKMPYDSYPPSPYDAPNVAFDAPKNAFFWLPPHQHTTEIPDPGPDLHASIRAYSSAGDAYLDLITSARAEDQPGSTHYRQEVYSQTFAYDRWWYHEALHERPRGPGIDRDDIADDFLPGIGAHDPLAAADDFAVIDDGTPPTAEQLLGSVPSVPGMRRYLAAELDELYGVQQQLRDLAARWYRLNWRFVNSGWNPSSLEPEPTVGGFTTREPTGHGEIDDFQVLEGSGGIGSYTTGERDDDGGRTTVGGFAAADSSETALRRAIVAEMVTLLGRAADAGCLEPGITPCDWSPAKLAARVLRSPDRAREQAFTTCQSFVDGVAEGSTHAPSMGLMMNLLGDTLVFEMANGAPSCQVAIPESLLPSQIASIRNAANACRDQQATAQEQVYLETIREETDLWDSATGQVRNPGFRKTREEQMGNDFFGLTYAYDYGYELDLSDGVCAPEAFLGAEFSAGLDVLTIHRSLIDVAARIDSNETTNDGLLVDVHADVLGQPIFDPVSVPDQGLGGAQYEWSAVVEGSHGIDQTLATARFVIVFVPVSISAGIAAEIGFRAGLEVEAQGFGVPNECPRLRVGGELTPFAGASGFVEAGIDIGIAAAGIRGELTILEAELPFRPGFAITSDAAIEGDYENLAASLTVEVEVDAKLRLRTLDGTISAFAEAGICPFCVRAEVDIIDWRGPSFDQTLYHGDWQLELGLLAEILGE
ncbi:MAG: hypothetical protein KC586_03805 [Myxococcales bacterium]|nr:hypothetical protein [Myxococcales bacterium]